MRKVINQNGSFRLVRSALAGVLTLGVTSMLLVTGLTLGSSASAAAVQITPTNLPTAKVGAAYNSGTLTVATSGTWAVSSGSLPAGLALTPLASSTTDSITGTSTADGTYNFTVTVTDSVTPATYTQVYTLVVTGLYPSTLTSPILVNSADTSSTMTVATAGTWAISSGTLPTGLALTTSTSSSTDTITGTPTVNGTYAFTITVTDAITPETYSQKYTLVVASQIPQPALSLYATTASLGNSVGLITSGGSGTSAPTYTVTNGTATGCAISGTSLTATTVGTCLVKATEAATTTYLVANSATVTFTFIAVAKAPPVLTATHVRGTAVIGKTVTLTIAGTAFSGKPKITSTNRGTRVAVIRDTGTLLTVRVTATAAAHKGSGTFTITEANGDSCTVKYVTKA